MPSDPGAEAGLIPDSLQTRTRPAAPIMKAFQPGVRTYSTILLGLHRLSRSLFLGENRQVACRHGKYRPTEGEHRQCEDNFH